MRDGTEEVAIIGGGLAGSLLAILLARRGLRPTVYERDAAFTDHAEGRSINLALAARGISALKRAGAYSSIAPLLLPMKGRMVHEPTFGQRLHPYGQQPHEVNYSVSRAELNLGLHALASERYGVDYRFAHPCVGVDTDRGQVIVESPAGRLAPRARAIFAADGAGSAVRRGLAEGGLVEPTVEPLDHGYKELTVAPGADGDFALSPDALHIWPRGGFMLIALPNRNKTFTATLFLPKQGDGVSFASLARGSVSGFFEREFPDAAPLIPELQTEFEAHPTGSLSTIRCRPWSWGHRILLLGDAAHGIVPFHGQGANAAFEDCAEIDDLVEKLGTDWSLVFERFEARRMANADAIARMALENYREMRDSVREETFRLQSALAFELERRFPGRFIPRYSMVMFHPEIPYAEAWRRGAIQAEILDRLSRGARSLDDVDFELAARLIQARL